MLGTARLFNCARCGRQVAICRRCDRGNHYCGPDCARAARRAGTRAAGARYQRSRPGRFAHAQRQRRYRARQRKVTHRGSPAPPPGASLPPESRASAPPGGAAPVPAGAGLRCSFCGRTCSAFVRLGFLRQRRDEPLLQRPSPARAQSP